MTDPDCKYCKGTGIVDYYYDAGDHFGASTAPESGWRTKECKCVARGATKANSADERIAELEAELAECKTELQAERNNRHRGDCAAAAKINTLKQEKYLLNGYFDEAEKLRENHDRLRKEIVRIADAWTDGGIGPVDAMKQVRNLAEALKGE